MQKLKTIIAGSRSIKDATILEEVLPLVRWDITTVLCGMAIGIDTIGKQWAESNGIRVLEYPAEWEYHGRRAGHIRNERMARNADALLLIWDGDSPGSRDMLNLAVGHKLCPILVYIVDKNEKPIEQPIENRKKIPVK